MTKFDPDLIMWFDCETTGAPTNHVIEVAIIVTDRHLQVLDSMTGTIEPPLGFRVENAVPVVREMHEKSGLWEECMFNSTWGSYDEADRAMYNFLHEVMNWWHNEQERILGEDYDPDSWNFKYMLAGSGVSHYDAPLIVKHFPLTWMGVDGYIGNEFKGTVDLGVMRRFIKMFVESPNNLLPDEVEIPHRALDDLHVFVAQARWYREMFQRVTLKA